MKSRNGIALIVVIIIVALTAFALTGAAISIANAARLTTLRMDRLKAYNAAQYGVMWAVREYAMNGIGDYMAGMRYLRNYNIGFGESVSVFKSKIEPITITASNINRSVYDATISNIIFTNRGSNAYFGGSATVTKLDIAWYNMTATLTSAKWNSTALSVTSTASKATVTVNKSLAAKTPTGPFVPASLSLTFTSNVPSDAVIVMTTYARDGSAEVSKRTVLLNTDGYSGNNEFTITATGKCGAAKRTIEAAFDVDANKITSWVETNNHI